MSAKHTPGPWWVDAKSFGGVETFTVRNEAGKEVASGQHIATRRKADARLIAAAPELLEALRGLLHKLDIPQQAMGLAADIYRARAAIAKAEGKS